MSFINGKVSSLLRIHKSIAHYDIINAKDRNLVLPKIHQDNFKSWQFKMPKQPRHIREKEEREKKIETSTQNSLKQLPTRIKRTTKKFEQKGFQIFTPTYDKLLKKKMDNRLIDNYGPDHSVTNLYTYLEHAVDHFRDEKSLNIPPRSISVSRKELNMRLSGKVPQVKQQKKKKK